MTCTKMLAAWIIENVKKSLQPSPSYFKISLTLIGTDYRRFFFVLSERLLLNTINGIRRLGNGIVLGKAKNTFLCKFLSIADKASFLTRGEILGVVIGKACGRPIVGKKSISQMVLIRKRACLTPKQGLKEIHMQILSFFYLV